MGFDFMRVGQIPKSTIIFSDLYPNSELENANFIFHSPLYAPIIWQQLVDFPPGERYGSFCFVIGTKGYIGTGYREVFYDDFWEYDTVMDIWTQKQDFLGDARNGGIGFSIGNKGYAGLGRANLIYYADFYEYNPNTNTWAIKTPFFDVRDEAVGFSIGNKGYVGTGRNADVFPLNPCKKDFWEYDPVLDTWTPKTDFPGVERFAAVSFVINNEGYIGLGWGSIFFTYFDFYKYNPIADTWTLIAIFPSTEREAARGFSIGDRGYVIGGMNLVGSGVFRDVWEYNSDTNIWIQKEDFFGSARSDGIGFSVGYRGYFGLGADFTQYPNPPILFKDFWVIRNIYCYKKV